MAKRRSKTRAKRRFAGLDRKVKINGEIVEKMMEIETKTNQDSETGCTRVVDLDEKVQVTESAIILNDGREKENNVQNNSDIGVKKMIKHKGRKSNKNDASKKQNNGHGDHAYGNMTNDEGRKSNKNEVKKKQNNGHGDHAYGNVTNDEVLIFPKEIDGETCIEIKCGNNDAQLYLSKLSVGSKGACIHYSGSWLTPNEFQSVSGRETAKDWKRSIRHRGKSLKMLIAKGLITVQSIHSAGSRQVQEKNVQKSQSAGSRQIKEKNIQKSPEAPRIDNVSLEQKQGSEEARDRANNAEGGNDVSTELKADTKQIPKKRGRKPKKQRQGKASTKDVSNFRASSENNIPEQIAETSETKPSEEIKHGAQISETHGSPTADGVETQSADDTQAEEERRLDEFVKTLRLTKAVVAPKSAPALPTIETIKVEPASIDEADPEMPILQKEADILPEQDNDHLNITVNVDTFHATVTPPPTPPGDKVMIDRKTDDEKLNETFKSRLASPSNGVKLTISRDKVNIDGNDNSKIGTDLPDSAVTDNKTTKPNMQTLLLQDALQSARKYKEQLKQNTQTSPTKPVIRVPTVKSKTDQKSTEKSLIQNSPPSVIPKDLDHERQQFVEKTINKTSQTRHDQQGRRNVIQTNGQPPNGMLNNMPSVDDMKNLAGMSFQDLLAGMSSVYGPPPCSTDTKDTSYAALQEMHRRYDMLRLITQGQVDDTSSSMLYPMMTQHLLLAMTQQLYSMYNVPGWLPSVKPPSSSLKSQTPDNQHHNPSNSQNITQHRQPARLSETQHCRNPSDTQNRRIPQTTELQYRRMSQTPDLQNRRMSQTPELQHRRMSQTPELQHRRMSQTPELQHRRMSQTPELQHRRMVQTPELHHRQLTQPSETKQRNLSALPQEIQYRRNIQLEEIHDRRLSVQKRKHSELVTDCAIDLSVKRNKIEDTKKENSVSIETRNLCDDVTGYDVPLDYSLKKTKDQEKCHNRKTENDRFNGSFNMLRKVEYSGDSREMPFPVHVPESNSKRCTCDSSKDHDITAWSVEQVCCFLKELDGCAQYAKTFHEQGISGRLLPYLTTQHLTRTLGMKVGPALTLIQAVERRFRDRHSSSVSTPRHGCVIHQTFTMPVHIS